VSGELERSARQLGTFIDLQQQFASDAAHQLRTPLTSIGLHLDEISRVGDEAVREESEVALAQVERLDDVISSLLARARGDSAEPVLLDLAALIADGCTSWERVLAQAGRRLHCEVRPPIPVRARREHLLGVLASLLDNAVTHGAGDISVRADRSGSTAVLRVRDDGPGVGKELQPHVFERRVSGGQGTGIGLALARSLAAAEFGVLTLSDSDPAEFVLTLPTAAPGDVPAQHVDRRT
jgi:signal transduction histidine kinase